MPYSERGPKTLICFD